MENKKISSIILKEKDDILNLFNILENQTHKGIFKFIFFCVNIKPNSFRHKKRKSKDRETPKSLFCGVH